MARIIYLIRQCWLDFWAAFGLLKEQLDKKSNNKIRVGFMCQYIPAWNKLLPVYNKLKEDDRFEVYLLCVPNRIENKQLVSPENLDNDTYEYFKEKGYDAINTLIGKNEWLDLKGMGLDYIFYTRPYNSFMPEVYSSKSVSKYSKICVMMYGMILVENEWNTALNRDFFRHVYCYFAETECSMKMNKKHYPITHMLGIQKSIYHGMPALEQFMKAKEEKTNVWDFSDNTFRVMWTPRWTTEPSLGGTNFFLYKEALLNFAKEHKDMDFLFRPHPLAFQNFMKTGEMTENEVTAYKQQISDLSNVCLDVEKEYVATMWNSSVLVSDLSGVVPEYFVTGKPIIYCRTNMILQPTAHFNKLIEGCYSVSNEEELFYWLEELQRGNDPLYGKRQQIIEELFGEKLNSASDLILNELTSR